MPRVKVQAKIIPKAGKTYKSLYVTLPSAFASVLGIKEGDYLEVTITDINVEGKTVRAIAYYKP
ncbi:MAG: AbrB/MazE/SpoVT family DNA-binding domain-containing protein [Crenarchaeota archaeon]|nr:AbrB/MazE/SpoVT family DNA-binding domain-containing protein [Thermoproteota archaeon]